MASAASVLAGGGISNAIADLIETVKPSVVQIRLHGRGVGAGVVWNADGGIVTNHHVVGDLEGPVEVRTGAGRAFPAAILRRHPGADLALLQAPAGGLQPVTPGDSTALRAGQLVFAIGHPWGQPDVVTAGIVSGIGELAAPWRGAAPECIRSDVRLAPGNSGGPLVDAAGCVVGINSMIFGGDLSVAIPVHVVQRWLAESPVPHAFLGVELRPVRHGGLLVAALREGGPAHQAGVLLGDLLVGLDGAEVPQPEQLTHALAAHRPGETALLEVVRLGARRIVPVALGTAERA